VRGSWAATMQASFLAAVGRPAWWAVALAGFLLRGGIVIAILPILALPTTADLTTILGPTVEDLLLGGPSVGTVVAETLLISGALVAVYSLAYAGSWLDLALLRDASADPELELGWSPANRSAVLGLGIRLTAHLPTTLALGFASVRIVQATYVELTSPSDAGIPLPARVLGDVPDALLLVGVAWLLGETIGGLTARRVAAGEPVLGAFGRSIRQVASPRGLGTLAMTTVALGAVLVPFELTVATGWRQVRAALFDGADPALILAALVLMVSTWVLGLALLGALLAWRATAWTLQVAPRSVAVTQPMLQASEPSR
jgi:hypothetical protein